MHLAFRCKAARSAALWPGPERDRTGPVEWRTRTRGVNNLPFLRYVNVALVHGV